MSNQQHEHVILINGRAKAAQVYPPQVCRAVCQGLIEQIEMDQAGQFLIAEVNTDEGGSSLGWKQESKRLQERYRNVEEDNTNEMEMAWDDVFGAELNPTEVRKARQEEIDYVRNMKLYTKVPIEECYANIGRAPITVRWIDINKGDQTTPNYRSRLVAREINTHKRDDLFAGTPPLEALKCIVSIAASGSRGEVIMINDVGRAFFHPRARRDVYVQMADEDKQEGDERKRGRLNFSMYGIRGAAQNWANEYADMLKFIGLKQGQASPCVCYHDERKVRTFVHGDDYVSTAMPTQLTWLRRSSKRGTRSRHNGLALEKITNRN